jgi:DNA repair protein RadC
MTIKDLPQRKRPDEKMLTRGLNALSDEALLAIFCSPV